ncbi:hypothetical protein RUM44_001545 [Polyplax serrata]|uniref:C2H2-type domain-containing protein n=1 Tax=Polyplax serrata TaxID=468196 RepID=A0ABR1AM23_POLSC
MDLRVHRNEDPYWIPKQNVGVREHINPYNKSENIVPAHPVRIEVEVDHSLFGESRENRSFPNETYTTGTKRKTRTKCNCIECNPDFAGNPNPTPNVFQCNLCQKCFTKCKYFRRHVGLHGKTKTLKCDLCQVSFMFSYQLQSHRLTHTHGQKPFQCSICRKSFTSKYYLKQHEWVHNPITPFKCRVCGKGYSSEGYFKRHELSHAQ